MSRPVTQGEFDTIVEENVEEFEMDEVDAIADALAQLKGRDLRDVAKTTAEKKKREELLQLCATIDSTRENLNAIRSIFDEFKGSPSFLIRPMVEQGGLGMVMTIIAKEKSVIACELVQLICDNNSMARDVVPQVGLGVLNDLLLSSAKELDGEDDDTFIQALLAALVSTIKSHELNKRALHEKGFNDTLNALVNVCTDNRKSLLLNTVKAIRLYVQDDDDRPGAIEYDGFIRARKLGEETSIVSQLTKHLSIDDTVSASLRLICVNDNVCRRALDSGALDYAMGWITNEFAPNNNKISSLALIRHLCLNDDAKVKVGLTPAFARGLVHVVETALDENDENTLTAAVSCIGIVALRQPRCCDAFAEIDAIPLLVRCLRESQSSQVHKVALIALRNFLSHPINEPLKQKALDAGAEKACRDVSRDLKDFIESCLRDLGVANYRI